MSEPHRRHGEHSRLEVVSIDGRPDEAEKRAIARALEELAAREKAERTASVWLRAGRAQGRRLGMFDYHDRFEAADAWRLSTRFPFGGREYPGMNGRGDAK
ncbi:MAG: hypothetical protein M3360_03510 [Actinomycetota bacterium]|nr:hypothetical protein [Actinomycetota bacterium]